MVHSISILGSTGSIGRQTVAVAEHLGLNVRALTTNHNIQLAEEQARRLHPAFVAVTDEASAKALRIALADTDIAVGSGENALCEAAVISDTDAVVTAVSGAVGLRPTLAAIEKGRRIALANKETLVCAGNIVMRRAKECGAEIVPVDSEHSAIFPCLTGRTGELHKILLTGSGGPFRGWKRADMENITPEQALHHPTWNMGPVVTINSSTLMNKGLEVIEASRLFNVPPERIDVTVHPQSIVHSMVEFVDGATICQASPPDMRLPIALGLSAPDRMTNVAAACDWTQAATWTFEPLDDEAFPAVQLARHCLAASEKHTAVLNAANEQAVHAFLEHRLPYLGIVDTVKAVLDQMDAELRGNPLFTDVEEMNQLELEARRRADDLINKQ